MQRVMQYVMQRLSEKMRYSTLRLSQQNLIFNLLKHVMKISGSQRDTTGEDVKFDAFSVSRCCENFKYLK